MSKVANIMMTCLILAGMAGLLTWGYVYSREREAGEMGREHLQQTPSRVAVQGNAVVVTLDAETLRKSAIATAPLTALSHQAEVQATGTVLPLQSLFEAQAGYVSARAQQAKARATLASSREEYERLKRLNDDHRNISDKVFQAAEAAWRVDQATLQAADGALQTLTGVIRQQWGGVITGWLLEDSPVMARLAGQDELLLQVTLPQGVPVEMGPASILVQAADRTPTITARLISPAPFTDPHLQGVSFFYRAPARSGLLPGMNVLARLPVGPTVNGVAVPGSAVIWWQGKAWGYVQQGEGLFVRREVATDAPLADGFFVAHGFSPGERIVVRGAQLLHSEEYRSQLPAGGQGEEDND